MAAVKTQLRTYVKGVLPANAPSAYFTLTTALNEAGVSGYALGAPGVGPLNYNDGGNLMTTLGVSGTGREWLVVHVHYCTVFEQHLQAPPTALTPPHT